jgi:hypothetical protein
MKRILQWLAERQKKKPIHIDYTFHARVDPDGIVRATDPLRRQEIWSKVYGYQVFSGKAEIGPSFITRIHLLAELYGSQVCSDYCRIDKVTKEGRLVLTEWARAQSA